MDTAKITLSVQTDVALTDGQIKLLAELALDDHRYSGQPQREAPHWVTVMTPIVAGGLVVLHRDRHIGLTTEGYRFALTNKLIDPNVFRDVFVARGRRSLTTAALWSEDRTPEHTYRELQLGERARKIPVGTPHRLAASPAESCSAAQAAAAWFDLAATAAKLAAEG